VSAARRRSEPSVDAAASLSSERTLRTDGQTVGEEVYSLRCERTGTDENRELFVKRDGLGEQKRGTPVTDAAPNKTRMRQRRLISGKNSNKKNKKKSRDEVFVATRLKTSLEEYEKKVMCGARYSE